MFTIIGLLVGAFLGYLVSGFFDGLQPLRDSVKGGVGKALALGGNLLSNLTKSFGHGPLINIGIVVVVVLLLLWLIGFSTAVVVGIVAGVIYSDEVARVPFISGIATSIRQKISGGRGQNTQD